MKDYKKILEGVVNIINTTEKSDIGFANICSYIGENCPELKESEDERIRKAIINEISLLEKESVVEQRKNVYQSWLAWLEKQGEKPQGKSALEAAKEEKVDNQNCIKSYAQEHIGDKVEPKFKVCDWITNGATNPAQISSIKNGMYFTHNDTIGGDVESIDKEYHLWTIQDAKDGDVLATLDYILIFKEFLKDDGGVSYCHYDFGAGNPQFIWFEDENWYFGKEAIIHSATKEQRDTLMKAMIDAGYTFDFEKKELKKIEQKPADESKVKPKFKTGDRVIGIVSGMSYFITEVCDDHYNTESGCIIMFCSQDNFELYEQKPAEWSEDDENRFNNLCLLIDASNDNKLTKNGFKNWLKSIKDRVQSLPRQEWSEEEEENLKKAIKVLKVNNFHHTADMLQEMKYKLIPLEQANWKPSDEQMNLLEELVEDNSQRSFYTVLRSLYEQLKILREQ